MRRRRRCFRWKRLIGTARTPSACASFDTLYNVCAMGSTRTATAVLTRDQFRAAVFARDGHRCVVCGNTGPLDAHHIIERRLWPDGGYYIDNGASLCEVHHIEAEATTLSCDRLRQLCRITTVLLPPHLHPTEPVDKWGNPVLPSGMRLRGELFDNQSVQRVLSPVLALFTDHVKYPRTFHLPWSPGQGDDDRVLDDLTGLQEQEIVVTAKMDGENTTLYPDYLHARSVEYEAHPSRSWIRALHARVGRDIPAGWRVCGENLYAKHSIKYDRLPDYFLVFSIWNERNICLSWSATSEWTELLGLRTVPVLYTGPWDERAVRGCQRDTIDGDPCEGYVVRVAAEFHYRDFRRKAAKYVRAGHVQTKDHWMRSQVVRNGLASP